MKIFIIILCLCLFTVNLQAEILFDSSIKANLGTVKDYHYDNNISVDKYIELKKHEEQNSQMIGFFIWIIGTGIIHWLAFDYSNDFKINFNFD